MVPEFQLVGNDSASDVRANEGVAFAVEEKRHD